MSQHDSTKAPTATDGANAGPTRTKLVIELAPLVLFFLVYSQFDIYIATGVLMISTIISLIASKILLRKLSLMPLVAGAFVLVFGALTLWFSNETFIKIKPTIVYLCFAAPLLGGLLFRKSLLSYILGEAFTLDESGWRALTLRWGLFFVVLAALNELVWRNFSTSIWVSMKSFGFIPLTILFAVSQTPLVLRHQAQPQVGKKKQD